MTREEAIQWLTNEKWKNANNKYKKEWNEAFDMAIEALSAEPTIPMFKESAEAYKEWTGEDMGKSDLISRAEAVKVMRKLLGEDFGKRAEIELNCLTGYVPSADRPTIVRCKDCRWQEECSQFVVLHKFCGVYQEISFCSHGERREP